MSEQTTEIVRRYASPELTAEHDEEGSWDPTSINAGWDIAFGCRINFGPDPRGFQRVSVHVSDDAQRDGVAVTPASAADYRLLADYLLRVADEAERMGADRG